MLLLWPYRMEHEDLGLVAKIKLNYFVYIG